MRILVGTDFSDRARHALRVAAALASKTGGKVTLAHAVHPAMVEILDGSALDQYRKRTAARLRKEAALVAGRCAIEEKLILGRAETSLANLAAAEASDLIVIGAPQPRIRFASLRSTLAEQIQSRTSTPTLVVADTEPLLRSLEGNETLELFVCYDFSDAAKEALKFSGLLAGLFRNRLTLAYVSCPPDETLRFGVGNSMSLSSLEPQIGTLLRQNIARDSKALAGVEADEIRIVAACDGAGAELLNGAKTGNPSLMLLGAKKRSRLERLVNGSATARILRQGSMNTLTVPAYASDQPAVGQATYERVLVAAGVTSDTNRALAAGIEATRPDGEICLLHVVKPPRFRQLNKADAALLTSRRKELAQAAAARGARRKIRVEAVAHENPSVAICQAAERFGADAICLARSSSGNRKRRFKSTTRGVVRRSRRPVLIVPEII